jgi:hypothetical protein
MRYFQKMFIIAFLCSQGALHAAQDYVSKNPLYTGTKVFLFIVGLFLNSFIFWLQRTHTLFELRGS